MFTAVIFVQCFLLWQNAKEGAFFTSLTCLLIYILAFGYRPVGYKITKDEIVVCRPFRDVHINRKEIVSVTGLKENDIDGSIRTFGVGGLFGYYGRFYNFSMGRMIWYATRKDKPVLIKTATDNIILTPDDAETFVADAKQVA